MLVVLSICYFSSQMMILIDHEEIFETVQLLGSSVNKLFNFAKEVS